MIKNIVFDVGNVLVDFKPKEYIAKFSFSKEVQEQLYEIVFKSPEWLECDRGIYSTIAEYRDILIQQNPNLKEPLEQVLHTDWVKMHIEKQDTIAWLKEMKNRGYHIYLFSNCAQETFEYMKTLSFYPYIEGGAYSFEKHWCKPEEELYQYLFKKYLIKPEESIFLDDNVDNIKQAKICKMHGIVFENIDKAKQSVEAIIKEEEKI
ncbi:MAG: HAD-IA family hydrolase [Clostridia bacterium]